jgi:hypothetical protein
LFLLVPGLWRDVFRLSAHCTIVGGPESWGAVADFAGRFGLRLLGRHEDATLTEETGCGRASGQVRAAPGPTGGMNIYSFGE